MATKKFKCTVCGYIHEGDAAPEKCPVCMAPASAFVELKDEKKKGLFSDKNGNAYIIMYSTVMVVIVATLLAVAALSPVAPVRQRAEREEAVDPFVALGAG